jgi:hypothetical protein
MKATNWFQENVAEMMSPGSYKLLTHMYNFKPFFAVGLRRLVKESGLSEKKVTECIDELKSLGLRVESTNNSEFPATRYYVPELFVALAEKHGGDPAAEEKVHGKTKVVNESATRSAAPATRGSKRPYHLDFAVWTSRLGALHGGWTVGTTMDAMQECIDADGDEAWGKQWLKEHWPTTPQTDYYGKPLDFERWYEEEDKLREENSL